MIRNRRIELKIKIKSLTAEARLIRADENAARRKKNVALTRAMVVNGAAKLSNWRKRLMAAEQNQYIPTRNRMSGPYPKLVLEGFWPKDPKATAEQLAETAQYHDEVFRSLHDHRRGAVRNEARHAHLAYGFLYGRDYASMEVANTTDPPDWNAVWLMVNRFTDPSLRSDRAFAVMFANWVAEAVEHLRDSPHPEHQRPGNIRRRCTAWQIPG